MRTYHVDDMKALMIWADEYEELFKKRETFA